MVWIAGNVAPLYLIWLLWPRLTPAMTPSESPNSLWLNFGLALLFPFQHSIWTQTPIKRAIKSFLGVQLERPLYVISSGVALVATVFFWRCSDRVVWNIPDWSLWPLRIVMVGMVGAQIYSTTLLGAKFLTGIAHLKSLRKGTPLREPEFKERGLYRWIRHPIAASQIVMIWTAGTMFADRMVLALMWTAWIVVASALEDRRLGEEFGEGYEAYRRRAGFLWPKLIRG